MAGKGGYQPNAGRNPIGDSPRVMFGTRLDEKTVQAIDAMLGGVYPTRAKLLDALVDYVRIKKLLPGIKPMGENQPESNTEPLPASMGFNSVTLRYLDKLCERLKLETHEDAVNALIAFLREQGHLDAILEAMAEAS